MRLTPTVAALPVVLCLLAPRVALAQGEQALPMRPRTLRLTIDGEWTHASQRFGAPTPLDPTLAEGTAEPLGRYFGGDSLGTRELTFLAGLESQLRALSGLGSWGLNLGRSRLTVETSIRTTPLRLDYAVSSRLVLGVAVPIVRARTFAFLAGPDTANSATLGNVGFNPDLVTPGAFTAFRTEVDSALLALQNQAVNGPAALQAQAQALYGQLRPYLCGLYQLGAGNAFSGASPCFVVGSAGGAGAAAFLPWDTTEAGDSVTARLVRAQTDYENLRQQYAALGVAMPTFTSAYALPTAPLDSTGLRRFVNDPAFPLAAESLHTIVRTGIGDIELGGWFQVAASARLRSQVGALYRLGTGTMDRADNLVDVGTGDGQPDVELWTRNDLLLSPRLWVHAGARVAFQAADELERRVSPYWQPYAPATATVELRRQLGTRLALDVVPNWQIDESFGVAIGYHFFRQAATTYEYVSASDSLALLVPASVAGAGTEVTRMRVGAGVTFSTLSRYLAGRARLPYRVSWSYQKTFIGRGGQVERAGVMRLTIETYFRLF